jgi:hypothetical protein
LRHPAHQRHDGDGQKLRRCFDVVAHLREAR